MRWVISARSMARRWGYTRTNIPSSRLASIPMTIPTVRSAMHQGSDVQGDGMGAKVGVCHEDAAAAVEPEQPKKAKARI